MERVLIDPTDLPSRGWKALQPETGKILSGLALDDLGHVVRQYREANGLPLEANFARQLQNQICAAMAEDGDEADRKCRPLKENDMENPPAMRKFRKKRTDLENFAKAMKVVLDEKLAGDSVSVDKEEAERRALICAECPWNLPIANCWGCGALGSLYRSLTGRKDTTQDYRLKSCDVCGCDNKTQVHFSGEVLVKAASIQGFMAEEFPEHCWKKPLLGSHTN